MASITYARIDGLPPANDSCWVVLPGGPYPNDRTALHARLRTEMMWSQVSTNARGSLKNIPGRMQMHLMMKRHPLPGPVQ
jgi:hypothetical protein